MLERDVLTCSSHQCMVITCHTAIIACVKTKQSGKTLDLFAEMLEKILEPDVITYSASISACEKTKLSDKALELLEDMSQVGLEPSMITCNATMCMCEGQAVSQSFGAPS